MLSADVRDQSEKSKNGKEIEREDIATERSSIISYTRSNLRTQWFGGRSVHKVRCKCRMKKMWSIFIESKSDKHLSYFSSEVPAYEKRVYAHAQINKRYQITLPTLHRFRKGPAAWLERAIKRRNEPVHMLILWWSYTHVHYSLAVPALFDYQLIRSRLSFWFSVRNKDGTLLC